jgi:hypothetical protein
MTRSDGTRRGTVAPLTVLLMIPLVGMLAFSIDVGYVALVQSELQNAADAAALAGAEKLQGLYVQFHMPGQTQQSEIFLRAVNNAETGDCPKYTAKTFGRSNKAGNVGITVPDEDISFSYRDASGTEHPAVYPHRFPNTIKVVARRDNSANTPLTLFFGLLLKQNRVDLTAVASATIYTGEATSATPIPGVKAHILPVALDVNIWTEFLVSGRSGGPGGNIHYDKDGIPQLHVYPNPGSAPGSFGLIDVGRGHSDVPAFRNWVSEGRTPNDIQYLIDHDLLPVTVASPKWWRCGPDMRSSLVENFAAVMGQPSLIPVFAPHQGLPGQAGYQAARVDGSMSEYNVVGFVGVTVTQAEKSGDSMDISIQPHAVVDPTIVIPRPRPAGRRPNPTLGRLTTTFISAKLTQ